MLRRPAPHSIANTFPNAIGIHQHYYNITVLRSYYVIANTMTLLLAVRFLLAANEGIWFQFELVEGMCMCGEYTSMFLFGIQMVFENTHSRLNTTSKRI